MSDLAVVLGIEYGTYFPCPNCGSTDGPAADLGFETVCGSCGEEFAGSEWPRADEPGAIFNGSCITCGLSAAHCDC